jgi:hypothetical protein
MNATGKRHFVKNEPGVGFYNSLSPSIIAPKYNTGRGKELIL